MSNYYINRTDWTYLYQHSVNGYPSVSAYPKNYDGLFGMSCIAIWKIKLK